MNGRGSNSGADLTQETGEGPDFEKLLRSAISSPDVDRGLYATATTIRQGDNEVIVDFYTGVGGSPQRLARVILSPPHAREFHKALADNLKQHAAKAKKDP